MNWKEYEIYITRHFQKLFPDSKIKHNVRKVGLLSKTSRQIDILISGRISGFELTIIVDCKFFSKKVDVKAVESFLSFLRDLKASKGVMITNVGYTKAAYNRATYDTQDIELRIINFEDLEYFQNFMAIAYSGPDCAVFSAPDGWVIDARTIGGNVGTLYPAGLTREEAKAGEGFIYIKFSKKDSNWPDLDYLLDVQRKFIFSHYRNPKIDYIKTIEREDCDTRLRVLEASELNTRIEYTLFLDFSKVIIFIPLLAPYDKHEKYLKKLQWVGEKLIKGKVMYDLNDQPILVAPE